MCYSRLLVLVPCSYEEKLTAEKQKQVVSQRHNREADETRITQLGNNKKEIKFTAGLQGRKCVLCCQPKEGRMRAGVIQGCVGRWCFCQAEDPVGFAISQSGEAESLAADYLLLIE